MLKKNENDKVFEEASPEEPVPDEEKDEEDERSPAEEQENRAPADDHYSSLPEAEEVEVVGKSADEEGELVVNVTPAQVEGMNPVSPHPVFPPSTRAPLECDYDVDPTALYGTLQGRQWDESIKRCKDHDEEARTWVSRKEKNGKLRWRLLPLHAAVIFKAPDDVIGALLVAYPRGAECKDDQGMLPLHLAFRNGSDESVINLLLAAYPKSAEVTDRKGRVPLALAQPSASPNKGAFMKALERGPSYFATAAVATERASITAEHQAVFAAKLHEKEEAHQEALAMLRVDAEQKQMDYEEKIKQLTHDLVKTQETSQVLVDHVNTLEAQLSSRTDTERFLATRIAALDTNLKQTAKGKEEIEESLKEENETLKKEKLGLEEELNNLKEEHSSLGEKLATTEEELAKAQEGNENEWKELRDSLATLQKEWASAKASEAILEAQLKKRIKSEKALAAEVSFLASRLAESAHDSGESVGNYSYRVRTLEQERDDLRTTVKALTDKLGDVAAALDEMMNEQQRIVDAASLHDESMMEAIEIHSKLISHTRRHQELFDVAQKEREDLVLALKEQAEEAAKQSDERKAVLEAFELQEEAMEDITQERKQLIARVGDQRSAIRSLIENDLSGITPLIFNTNADQVVDEMVKIVTSNDTAENSIGPVKNEAPVQKQKTPLSLEEALKRVDERMEQIEAKVEDVPEADVTIEDEPVTETTVKHAPETDTTVENTPETETTVEHAPATEDVPEASPRVEESPVAGVAPAFENTPTPRSVRAACNVEEALQRIESRIKNPTAVGASPQGGRVFNFEGTSTDEVEGDKVQSVRDAP